MSNDRYPGSTYNPRGAHQDASRTDRDIDMIIVHDTEGTSFPVIYGSGGGAHYGVSRQGAIDLNVPEKDIAYHAANWPINLRSIGIELVGFSGQPYPDAQVRGIARLSAYLARKYNITVSRDRIMSHAEVTLNRDRSDPGPTFPWDSYFKQIREFLGTAAASKTPATPKTLYRVRSGPLSSFQEADKLGDHYQTEGIPAWVYSEKGAYYVQTGSFSTKASATALAARIIGMGHDARVV